MKSESDKKIEPVHTKSIHVVEFKDLKKDSSGLALEETEYKKLMVCSDKKPKRQSPTVPLEKKVNPPEEEQIYNNTALQVKNMMVQGSTKNVQIQNTNQSPASQKSPIKRVTVRLKKPTDLQMQIGNVEICQNGQISPKVIIQNDKCSETSAR